jgi:phage shock protein E
MKTLYRNTLISFLLLFSVLIIYAFYYSMSSPYRINSSEAKEMIRQNYFDVILDVRTQTERDTLGFYPNSLHIPSAALEAVFQKEFPDIQTKILIYCNTGQRARKATEILRTMGYTNTLYIAGSHTSLF